MKVIMMRFVYNRLIIFADSVAFSLVAYVIAKIFFN